MDLFGPKFEPNSEDNLRASVVSNITSMWKDGSPTWYWRFGRCSTGTRANPSIGPDEG